MVHISLKVQVMFKNGHFKTFQNLVLLFIAGLEAPNLCKSEYAHYNDCLCIKYLQLNTFFHSRARHLSHGTFCSIVLLQFTVHTRKCAVSF